MSNGGEHGGNMRRPIRPLIDVTTLATPLGGSITMAPAASAHGDYPHCQGSWPYERVGNTVTAAGSPA